MRWSLSSMRKSMRDNLKKGLWSGLLLAVPVGLSIGVLSDGLSGVIGGLIIAEMVVIGVFSLGRLAGGLSQKAIPEQIRVKPDQGIRSSLSNSIWMGVLSAFVTWPFWILIWGIFPWLINTLALKLGYHFSGIVYDNLPHVIQDAVLLGPIPTFAVAVAWRSGATVVFQHLFLRLLLWRERTIPRDYTHFLDKASEHMFLHKVGGGYIFVRRLLLEYFADLDPDKTKL